MLLTLIGVSPFIEGTRGSYLLAGLNAFIVLSAAAARGPHGAVVPGGVLPDRRRGGTAFRVAGRPGQAALFNWALVLHVLVYITVIALLLRYVFGPEVMDSDRCGARRRRT